jgi:phage terminase small subunit
MALTQKQEAFCLAYIETAGNASEAYRRAYNAENMQPLTINKRASELLCNSDIAGRLSELRAPAIKKAQITLEQHLNDLKRLRDLAEASEKYGPAIQAEVNRGKASGLYVERVENTGKDGGPIEHAHTLSVALDFEAVKKKLRGDGK